MTPSIGVLGSYASSSRSSAGSQLRTYTAGLNWSGSPLSTDLFSPRSGPGGPHRLTTIAERTENPSSPTLFQPSAGNRNSVLSANTARRSTHSSHLSAAIDPTERVTSPLNAPKRAGELIAFLEEKTDGRPPTPVDLRLETTRTTYTQTQADIPSTYIAARTQGSCTASGVYGERTPSYTNNRDQGNHHSTSTVV